MQIHYGKPKLKISTEITMNKYPLIKILNASRRYEIYDLYVYIRYYFGGNNYYADKPHYVPLLCKRPMRNSETIGPYQMLFKLNGPKREADSPPMLSGGKMNQAREKGLEQNINDYFDEPTCDRRYIEVGVLCCSKFGGGIKYIFSQRYQKQNIVNGATFKDDSVEVERNEGVFIYRTNEYYN